MKFQNYILPVVLGTIAGVALVFLGENLMHSMYPLPNGIDESNFTELGNWMKSLDMSAYLLLLSSYAIGAFVSGITSTLVLKKMVFDDEKLLAAAKEGNFGAFKWPSIISGIMLTLAGIFNLLSISHPIWFSIVNVVEFLPFAYLGYLLSKPKVR
jgi:hypothetical protein